MTNPYPITPRQLDLDKLSGSHLTEQGVYPDIKMGVVASYNVSGGSAETVLKSTASGGITLGSLNVQGNSVLRNVIPENTDTYDLGSSIQLWRKGWLSELDTVLFAENTASLVGGWLIIGKDEGSIPSFVNSTDTTIDFGKAMAVGGSVVFRSSLQVEYIGMGTLASGSTVYNVVRNLDGSGANDWVEGSVFLVLGESGDGRIELNAYDSPRISVIEQGATYNSQTERIRIGDLASWQSVGLSGYGMAFGNYSGGEYLTYSPAGGLVVRGTIRADDGYLQNLTVQGLLNLSTAGELRAGDTTNGLRFGYLSDGYYLRGIGGGVTQVEIKAADGKLYAGGGDVILDTNGITILPNSTANLDSPNAIKWTENSITSSAILGWADPINDLEYLNIKVGSANDQYRNIVLQTGETSGDNYALLQIVSPPYASAYDSYIEMTSARVELTGSGSKSSKIIIDEGAISFEGENDGWISLDFNPAYVSEFSIVFYSMNITMVFPMGTKIKFTQTTTKYFYVLSSSYSGGNTTLTLTGVGLYTVATPGGITNFYYSHSAEPEIPIGSSTFIPLTTPLTSTSWDGDAYSTTAKTKIDLSAVFGVPAGIKAVSLYVDIRDSASASTDCYIYLDPTNKSGQGLVWKASEINDRRTSTNLIVACDANGDIYYQIVASGASTMDVWLRVHGYWI